MYNLNQTNKNHFFLLLSLLWLSVGRMLADNTVYGYEYVDLGLPSGLLWATCNVGATSPEQYGVYFAWGSTGHFGEASNPEFYGVLPPDLDAATVAMNKTWLPSIASGSKFVESWRMPTYEEMLELKNNTTITTETLNGVTGRRLTSKKKSNSIFIPFCGYYENGAPKNVDVYANLWTSSAYDATQAYACWFKNTSGLTFGGIDPEAQMCIRPVCPKLIKATGITLHLSKSEIVEHYCELSCHHLEWPDSNEHMILLSVTITPENATEQLVSFSGAPGEILTQDHPLTEIYCEYLMTPSAYLYVEEPGNWLGTHTITASTTDGTNLTASAELTIKPEIISSGKCGDNLYYEAIRHWNVIPWGELTISGSGDMYDISLLEGYNYVEWITVKFEGTPTSIGSYAFSSGYLFFPLKEITLPESITKIGDYAFGFTSISEIRIPANVTSLGKGLFYECGYLTSILVDERNTKYDSRNNCNAIIETATNTLIAGCNSTIIPNSVSSIGAAAFQGCDKLTTIEIPTGVTSIGNMAFYECDNLTSIYVGPTPISITDDVFDCENKCTLYVPTGCTQAYQKAEGWNEFQNIVEYNPIEKFDVNRDGHVNVADLINLADFILNHPELK